LERVTRTAPIKRPAIRSRTISTGSPFRRP